MKKSPIVILVLVALVAAGCAAPGSKEAQVAGWRRQLARDSDARVERRSAAAALAQSRDLAQARDLAQPRHADTTDEQGAAEFGVFMLFLLLGGLH